MHRRWHSQYILGTQKRVNCLQHELTSNNDNDSPISARKVGKKKNIETDSRRKTARCNNETTIGKPTDHSKVAQIPEAYCFPSQMPCSRVPLFHSPPEKYLLH